MDLKKFSYGMCLLSLFSYKCNVYVLGPHFRGSCGSWSTSWSVMSSTTWLSPYQTHAISQPDHSNSHLAGPLPHENIKPPSIGSSFWRESPAHEVFPCLYMFLQDWDGGGRSRCGCRVSDNRSHLRTVAILKLQLRQEGKGHWSDLCRTRLQSH